MLENMLRRMSLRGGMKPHLTNQKAVESRHIKTITGHQSDGSIERHCDTPKFHTSQNLMSHEIANFIDYDIQRVAVVYFRRLLLFHQVMEQQH